MSDTTKVKLTDTGLPQVIELSADATAVGKTTAAWRIRHHFDQHGIKTVMVTIESRGVTRSQAYRRNDIFISTEDFKRASELPGGIVGVLEPLYAAIEQAGGTDSIVIVDWAGGQAQARLEALAATQFDQRLAELNIVGLSVIVTTAAIDKMRQAAENLTQTQAVAPGLQRALLLNARGGAFDFIPNSAAAGAYKGLLKAAQGAKVIRFPAIEGESWQECQQAGLSMLAVIKSTPADLAAKTKLNRFTAAACCNEIRAWYKLTEASLSLVLPFRAASDGAA